MERVLRLLDSTNDDDNCYMTQVHNYKGVSMFRFASEIKNVRKKQSLSSNNTIRNCYILKNLLELPVYSVGYMI